MKKYVDAGWGGVHIAEKYGGGGMPYTVGVVDSGDVQVGEHGLLALSAC